MQRKGAHLAHPPPLSGAPDFHRGRAGDYFPGAGFGGKLGNAVSPSLRMLCTVFTTSIPPLRYRYAPVPRVVSGPGSLLTRYSQHFQPRAAGRRPGLGPAGPGRSGPGRSGPARSGPGGNATGTVALWARDGPGRRRKWPPGISPIPCVFPIRMAPEKMFRGFGRPRAVEKVFAFPGKPRRAAAKHSSGGGDKHKVRVSPPWGGKIPGKHAKTQFSALPPAPRIPR